MSQDAVLGVEVGVGGSRAGNADGHVPPRGWQRLSTEFPEQPPLQSHSWGCPFEKASTHSSQPGRGIRDKCDWPRLCHWAVALSGWNSGFSANDLHSDQAQGPLSSPCVYWTVAGEGGAPPPRKWTFPASPRPAGGLQQSLTWVHVTHRPPLIIRAPHQSLPAFSSRERWPNMVATSSGRTSSSL